MIKMLKNRKAVEWGKVVLVLFAILLIGSFASTQRGSQLFSVPGAGADSNVYSNPYETPTASGGYLNWRSDIQSPIQTFAIFPGSVSPGQKFSGKWQHTVDPSVCNQGAVNDPSIHINIDGPANYHDSALVWLNQIIVLKGSRETSWEYTFPVNTPGGPSVLESRVYEEESGDKCYAISGWDSTSITVSGATGGVCSSSEKVYTYRCANTQVLKRVGPEGSCPESWTNVRTVSSCVVPYSDDINDFDPATATCQVGQFKCENGFVQKCASGGDWLLYKICSASEVCSPGSSSGQYLQSSEVAASSKGLSPAEYIAKYGYDFSIVDPDSLCSPTVIPGDGGADTDPEEDQFEPTWNAIAGECIEQTFGTGKYTSEKECQLALGDISAPIVKKNSSGSSGKECISDTKYTCQNGKVITQYQCIEGKKKATGLDCGKTLKNTKNESLDLSGVNKTDNKTENGDDKKGDLKCEITQFARDGHCVSIFEDKQSLGLIVGGVLVLFLVIYGIRRFGK